MDNIFLVAGIISIIFFIAKFLEMRYIEKDAKPLKVLIRDSLIVYISVVSGSFILDQVNPIIKDNIMLTSPIAFTDNPPF